MANESVEDILDFAWIMNVASKVENPKSDLTPKVVYSDFVKLTQNQKSRTDVNYLSGYLHDCIEHGLTETEKLSAIKNVKILAKGSHSLRQMSQFSLEGKPYYHGTKVLFQKPTVDNNRHSVKTFYITPDEQVAKFYSLVKHKLDKNKKQRLFDGLGVVNVYKSNATLDLFIWENEDDRNRLEDVLSSPSHTKAKEKYFKRVELEENKPTEKDNRSVFFENDEIRAAIKEADFDGWLESQHYPRERFNTMTISPQTLKRFGFVNVDEFPKTITDNVSLFDPSVLEYKSHERTGLMSIEL
jgi:hypothetical protein